MRGNLGNARSSPPARLSPSSRAPPRSDHPAALRYFIASRYLPLPGLRLGQPFGPRPLPAICRRPALLRAAGSAHPARASLSLPQPGLPAPHLFADLLARHARRTRRLAQAQAAAGVALGGGGGSAVVGPARDARQRLHGAAFGARPAAAHTRGAPGRRRGRLGHEAAKHLRHHPRGPGAPA